MAFVIGGDRLAIRESHADANIRPRKQGSFDGASGGFEGAGRGLMRCSQHLRRLDGPRIAAGPLPRIIAGALIAGAAALVSGCSGSLIADHMPAAVGGLPADAPARPATEAPYPAVHNMPPARATTPLSYDQQKQLADDLIAARNRNGGNPDTTGSSGETSSTGTTGSAGTAGSTANAKAGSARNP